MKSLYVNGDLPCYSEENRLGYLFFDDDVFGRLSISVACGGIFSEDYEL